MEKVIRKPGRSALFSGEEAGTADGEKQRPEQFIQFSKLASLGEMVGGLAHELNNPIGGILGYAQLLRESFPDDDKRKQDIIKIEEASQRCKDIITDLLAFARQERVQFQPVAVNETIERTLTFGGCQLKVNGIKIIKDFASDLPVIAGDSSQLQEVFLNILLNAMGAMKRGGTLTISTKKSEGNSIKISFTDTGQGIPPENLSRIFDPFFTTKPAGEGTGLGLSVCHGIIKSHGGTIKVQSKPRDGTIFIITLPAKK